MVAANTVPSTQAEEITTRNPARRNRRRTPAISAAAPKMIAAHGNATVAIVATDGSNASVSSTSSAPSTDRRGVPVLS